ncbi:MAG: hypothetical protein ACXWPM_03215 [Bdellovibrionota bacterium]
MPLAASLACSSSRARLHETGKIFIYNVHYRRTAEHPAAPRAQPGDEEWQTKTAPNAKNDCEPLKNLFTEVDLAAVRACVATLNQSKKGMEVVYILRRQPAPYLEPWEPELTPDCLKSSLSKIPVPRELIYQAKENGLMSCYSARVDIEADEIYGNKVPGHYFKVKLAFPSDEEAPKTDYETRMLLVRWALTPLVDPERDAFMGKVVPDGFCRTCFGGAEELLDAKDPLPVQWP